MGARSTETTSPISLAKSAIGPPSLPEYTLRIASCCDCEAPSSTYRATRKFPCSTFPGICETIAMVRPATSTPSMLPLFKMIRQYRVTGPVVGILADPAWAQYPTIADLEQLPFQVVGHLFLPVVIEGACCSSIAAALAADAKCQRRGHLRTAQRRLNLHHRITAT